MTPYEKRSDFDWASTGEDAPPVVSQDDVKALSGTPQRTEPAAPSHPAPRRWMWVGLAIVGILLVGGALIHALIR